MNLAQDTWAAATISMHPWSPLGGRRRHRPIVPYPLLLGLCQAANFIASIQILWCCLQKGSPNPKVHYQSWSSVRDLH